MPSFFNILSKKEDLLYQRILNTLQFKWYVCVFFLCSSIQGATESYSKLRSPQQVSEVFFTEIKDPEQPSTSLSKRQQMREKSMYIITPKDFFKILLFVPEKGTFFPFSVDTLNFLFSLLLAFFPLSLWCMCFSLMVLLSAQVPL